jgi:hypothetical protein
VDAQQALLCDLKRISIQTDNADAFFLAVDMNPEVDQLTLYELMEMNGREMADAVAMAYAKFDSI